MAADSGLKMATRGLYLRSVDQDRLDRFRHAVPANLVRPITSHQPNQQTAHDGDQRGKPVQLVLSRRAKLANSAGESKRD